MSRYDRGEVTQILQNNSPTGKYEVACNCGKIAIVDSLDEGLEIAAAHDAAKHPYAQEVWERDIGKL